MSSSAEPDPLLANADAIASVWHARRRQDAYRAVKFPSNEGPPAQTLLVFAYCAERTIPARLNNHGAHLNALEYLAARPIILNSFSTMWVRAMAASLL